MKRVDKAQEIFDPQTDRYPYPALTDGHYLAIKKDNGTVYDENYPYIDRSPLFRLKQRGVRALLYAIVFPMARIRLGLKIEGRETLKQHRDALQNGVISCSNHIHLWDYISVMKAVRPRRTHVLVWAKNVSGENGTLIRLVGGVPIPENSMRGTKAYLQALHGLMDDGGWLHVYSEGSMWEFYQPIRPFKHGAAYLACEWERTIVPMAFSYRRPGWIRRKVFRQIACLTLRMGEPLFPDETLPLKERRRDLTVRSHEAVCRLAEIDPQKNLYPPVFNKTPRVDYYTDTYGGAT